MHARDGGWERARALSIVVFRIFCCAAKYCCVDVAENFDGSRLTLDVQLQSKCHTCSVSSSISQILTAQLRLQHSLYISTVTTLLIDCLCAVQKPNDHAYSFCRYTRFYRFGSRTLTSFRSTRHLSRMTFSCCVYRCDAAPPFYSSEVLPRQRVPSYRSSPMVLYRHSVPRLFIFYQIYSECGSKFPLSTARVLARLVLSLAHGPRQFSQPVAITCMPQYIRVFVFVFFLSEQGNTCQIRVCSLERRGAPHALH